MKLQNPRETQRRRYIRVTVDELSKMFSISSLALKGLLTGYFVDSVLAGT